MESTSMVDRAVLITGASGGIGRAVALLLGSAGARLALTGRSSRRLRETVEAVEAVGVDEERGFSVAADLTAPDAAEAVVNATFERLGRIDALVHCAGVGLFKPFKDFAYEEIDEVLDANLRTAIYTTRAALPALTQSQGHIVHVASGLARRAVKGAAVYAAAKFAVRGFCEGLRLDCARYGVRVSLVSPAGAGVDTNFWERADPSVKRAGMMPPGRVAEAVHFVLTAPPGTLVDDLTIRTA